MARSETYAENNILWLHRAVGALSAALNAIGRALIFSAKANRRVKLVEQLSAKSDAELAAMGIRREDIIRRVFHDMLDI